MNYINTTKLRKKYKKCNKANHSFLHYPIENHQKTSILSYPIKSHCLPSDVSYLCKRKQVIFEIHFLRALSFRGKFKKRWERISYISYISYELKSYREKLKKRWEIISFVSYISYESFISWETERNGKN